MSDEYSAENIGEGSPAGHLQTGPVTFAFDSVSQAQIALILAKYPVGRQASGVLPILYVVQDQMRRQAGSAWIPRVAMDVVAELLRMPPIRVYEVATFYLMFNTVPIGKYHLQVCTTTPCWLRGSDDVVAACRRVTGIRGWHETSEDGLFTMTEVECLGGCVNAPILQIDNDFYEDLDGPLTERLLTQLKRGDAKPQPGSMIGRLTSAPQGGPNTLTPVSE